MNTPTAKPSILSYVDYRLFLQAWYAYNKEHKRGFSYGTWTLQLGFKSRNHIRLVMIGQRNLGADSIAAVVKSLSLPASEAEYFEHLVHYANATSFDTKDYHFQQIVRLNKGQLGSQIRDVYKFLSNPKTPRVHLLLSLKDLKCTVPYIAETLDMTQAEAQDILNNIQSCGLATYDEATGFWVASESDLQIPNQLGNQAIQSFHNKSLEEAQAAISKDPTERLLSALLMTLDESEYKELQQDVEQFQNFLTKKYSSKKLAGSRIFQINLNVIPTSAPLQEKATQPLFEQAENKITMEIES
ncbi:TIGR02147 family protein [Bdellovibrio sp. KM01]|uniref:TIGR02147 family protein n=1 Tax=Bdellovibrio sp. KM01 TaxID=2748865 RepID=UPI0015E973C3|nr:TIGR02147 family protein [Bdellovibrio sp. KM01]QLY23988.1 TIGR02147 family protein [Bdellovibrio sp. KM01]